MSNVSSVGQTWADVRKELFTPEEIIESDLRVALIGEIKNKITLYIGDLPKQKRKAISTGIIFPAEIAFLFIYLPIILL